MLLSFIQIYMVIHDYSYAIAINYNNKYIDIWTIIIIIKDTNIVYMSYMKVLLILMCIIYLWPLFFFLRDGKATLTVPGAIAITNYYFCILFVLYYPTNNGIFKGIRLPIWWLVHKRPTFPFTVPGHRHYIIAWRCKYVRWWYVIILCRCMWVYARHNDTNWDIYGFCHVHIQWEQQ